MKILVTGAKGFVGQNLVIALENIRDGKDKTSFLSSNLEIYTYDLDSPPESLDAYCKDCDFVFHLAGVNRPESESGFMESNYGFSATLLETLKKHHNTCPVMLASSQKTEKETMDSYAQSKKAGEDLFFRYERETGAKVYVFHFPNLFGKWSKPNYNSVVATFSYNIAHGLPITVNDRSHRMTLAYIDDVVETLLALLYGQAFKKDGYCIVPVVHEVTLGEIADLLYSFQESRRTAQMPDMTEGSFSKKLYSTYLSYLPTDSFAYPLETMSDEKGLSVNFLKTAQSGQFSVNILKPGKIKGNHWHHSKNQKLLVVGGKGVVRFRLVDTKEVYEYFVSADKPEVLDIPSGYVHHIENIGDEDLVTLLWYNECYDPERPDTYDLEV